MEENVIDLNREEIKDLFSRTEHAKSLLERMLKEYRPAVNNERYYNNEHLEQMFHVDTRTLQNYRNDRKISYTRLVGKVLYLESDIRQLLEDNYVPAAKY